eukprot:594687_1
MAQDENVKYKYISHYAQELDLKHGMVRMAQHEIERLNHNSDSYKQYAQHEIERLNEQLKRYKQGNAHVTERYKAIEAYTAEEDKYDDVMARIKSAHAESVVSVISTQSQGSQFEMDCVQDTGNRILQSIQHQDSECTSVSRIDVYDQLMDVSEKYIINKMVGQNIIFDSLLKVQSATYQGYVDVAGVLSEHALYLISAHNHQMWIELRDRSKIMKLVSNFQDHAITKKIAVQIVRNLDFVDDEAIKVAPE